MNSLCNWKSSKAHRFLIRSTLGECDRALSSSSSILMKASWKSETENSPWAAHTLRTPTHTNTCAHTWKHKDMHTWAREALKETKRNHAAFWRQFAQSKDKLEVFSHVFKSDSWHIRNFSEYRVLGRLLLFAHNEGICRQIGFQTTLGWNGDVTRQSPWSLVVSSWCL